MKMIENRVEDNYSIIDLVVPKGIRYISDWEEYNLDDYPFPHILNKELTGCGYTEFCIRNDQDIILVSPRKFLLQNKHDQHPGQVLYVNNKLELSVDFELNINDDKASIANKQELDKSGTSKKEVKDNLTKLKENIRNYSKQTKEAGMKRKILVTYDSFRHVKDALIDEILDFQIVVDEFQSIFIDSHFKPDTEFEFLTHLNGKEREGGIKLQKVCYVSATPMLYKYLKELDEFKDLPYYRFNWDKEDPGRVKRPKLDIIFTEKSLSSEADKVIQSYLTGKYEGKMDPSVDGGYLYSKEAVLFFNSVDGICKAIRKNKLLPEQCNIICADTSSNKKILKDTFKAVFKKIDPDNPRTVDKDFNPIGEIPLKGEPHKMFTFCTRTVYLGADFYSTCARSFIFSDSNVDCLSVDISMDLEQILGRQRLDENPWKNSATMIVKTTNKKSSINKEYFNNILESKKKYSYDVLESYENTPDSAKENIVKTYEDAARVQHYKRNYISVNRFIDEKGNVYYKPVFNKLVLLSDIRSFEVQNVEYKDRFSVFSALGGEGVSELRPEIKAKYDEFNKLTNTVDKFKLIVNLSETEGIGEKDMKLFLDLVPGKYGDYYYTLGVDRIRANSYQESQLRKEWIDKNTEKETPEGVKDEIYSYFTKGGKFSKAKIKEMLKDIYKRYKFKQNAKASDLDIYFVMKSIKLKEDDKWVNGFEILGYR